MQNYPIDLKVNDPLFMQLIENFSTVPQTRKTQHHICVNLFRALDAALFI